MRPSQAIQGITGLIQRLNDKIDILNNLRQHVQDIIFEEEVRNQLVDNINTTIGLFRNAIQNFNLEINHIGAIDTRINIERNDHNMDRTQLAVGKIIGDRHYAQTLSPLGFNVPPQNIPKSAYSEYDRLIKQYARKLRIAIDTNHITRSDFEDIEARLKEITNEYYAGTTTRHQDIANINTNLNTDLNNLNNNLRTLIAQYNKQIRDSIAFDRAMNDAATQVEQAAAQAQQPQTPIMQPPPSPGGIPAHRSESVSPTNGVSAAVTTTTTQAQRDEEASRAAREEAERTRAYVGDSRAQTGGDVRGDDDELSQMLNLLGAQGEDDAMNVDDDRQEQQARRKRRHLGDVAMFGGEEDVRQALETIQERTTEVAESEIDDSISFSDLEAEFGINLHESQEADAPSAKRRRTTAAERGDAGNNSLPMDVVPSTEEGRDGRTRRRRASEPLEGEPSSQRARTNSANDVSDATTDKDTGGDGHRAAAERDRDAITGGPDYNPFSR
jgi:hypothetical protein